MDHDDELKIIISIRAKTYGRMSVSQDEAIPWEPTLSPSLKPNSISVARKREVISFNVIYRTPTFNVATTIPLLPFPSSSSSRERLWGGNFSVGPSTHLRTALMGNQHSTLLLRAACYLRVCIKVGNSRVPGSRPAQRLTLGAPGCSMLTCRSLFYKPGFTTPGLWTYTLHWTLDSLQILISSINDNDKHTFQKRASWASRLC